MGRITELIDFINRDKIPDKIERQFLYSYLSIDKKMIKTRKKYRKSKKT